MSELITPLTIRRIVVLQGGAKRRVLGDENKNHRLFIRRIVERGSHPRRLGDPDPPVLEGSIAQVVIRGGGRHAERLKDVGLAAAVLADEEVDAAELEIEAIDRLEVSDMEV